MALSKSKDYHKGKKIGVYIPEEKYNALKEYSIKSGESLTSIVNESINHFIQVLNINV